MTVTLKRKRGAVSYREPSSDDDFSDSDSQTAPRRKRAAPTRRSTRHHSTEAEQSSSRIQRRSASPPVRNVPEDEGRALRRRSKRKVSYRESSDEEGDDDFEPEEEVVMQRQPRVKTAQTPSPRKRNGVVKSHKRSPRSKLRMTLGAPLKPRTTPNPAPKTASIPTDGIKPSWESLPYHVLLQIFVYAAHPLHDENLEPTPSISWLAQTARICPAFTRPALTALYRNPPIFSVRQNRSQLVQHLTSPPANVHEDHQVMVKRLVLDATQMSSSTDPLHSETDLAALVVALTTCREIDIFDPLDRPPYRETLKRVRRWHYPDELFSALRQSNVRLRSWRWNTTFFAQGLGEATLRMEELHADGTFQGLRELILTKFHPDESRKTEDTAPTIEELLGSALAVLPSLRSIVFESCKVVNHRLLPLLPATLNSLNITNCFNLTSEALQSFLSDHGLHLEELVLNHNQCLDLSFMVDLKKSCPRLEILRMDLNYYSSLVMSSDNEPLYDWLLGVDEIPTWPSALRVIDLEYLRKWGPDAATNFFSSLIDSAGDLPWLRELRILAMVDVDWRKRADFRREWAARFERVFLRRLSAPNPHLASLKAYREWKASQTEAAGKNDSLLEIVEDAKQDDGGESDSDAPILPNRKKQDESWTPQRLRSRAKANAHYDETSETESDSESPDVDKVGEPAVVQGRCHTVILRIDNLRPREELFDEGDFLDEERSGDEEWTGNDVPDDDYAW